MDIQTAKDLIAKGIEYGDPDLVNMGKLMLEKFFPKKESSKKTKSKEPTQLILPIVENEEELEQEPIVEPKKKRGRPKKTIITSLEDVVEKPKERNSIEDFTAPTRKPKKTEDEDGEDSRRFTKSRKLNIKIKPMTLDLHKEDSAIDQILVNKNYKPERREPFTGYSLQCNTCEKTFKSDIFQSTCTKCLNRKAMDVR